MNDVMMMVLVWQVILFGAWVVWRRLRRLERSLRPPCYAQVGALREQVVGLRTEHALDADDLSQRTRDVEKCIAHVEDELRLLLHHQERQVRVLLERISQLEATVTAEVPGRRHARLTRSGS
jgi:hypothetical protein